MLAAIEIYNKPGFKYRDECFVILLLTAWELYLKALLSKNKGSIYYPKKRKQPYRTLSMVDAFAKAEKFFPKKIDRLPVSANLRLLSTYRDNAVHFYNERDFGVLIYSLGQTSIVNLKDLMKETFKIDLEKDISWQLMPLGLEPPIDPIAYISKTARTGKQNSATKQFLGTLASSLSEIDDAGADAGRLLTVFKVALESVKKIDKADLVVGVSGKISGNEYVGPLIVTKIRDPNTAYPLRQKELLKKVGNLHGKKFTSNTFQAVCHKYDFKKDPKYCWKAIEGVLTKYSNDLVPRIKSLTEQEVQEALGEYRTHIRRR
ncbi:MAG: DUF3644 domain-containing protein [Candidatus Komeilibacteria bacterium]|nr:DUF3644 domain-containing protein [Candidatus Komeilibacteria bacterium]